MELYIENSARARQPPKRGRAQSNGQRASIQCIDVRDGVQSYSHSSELRPSLWGCVYIATSTQEIFVPHAVRLQDSERSRHHFDHLGRSRRLLLSAERLHSALRRLQSLAGRDLRGYIANGPALAVHFQFESLPCRKMPHLQRLNPTWARHSIHIARSLWRRCTQLSRSPKFQRYVRFLQSNLCPV
ncbi:uncharacterized protein LOC6601555 isoform X1 [Drosophila persimilis]|uniref:uncharacterized protein LOC6601555 isoform X1 n=1 Tax=Drosophila persimilis TaxID=7234 RepID=UPI000F07361C|nr:uncharacterized protein LOC6601555 isoform X1 [Drosophila persimilis]